MPTVHDSNSAATTDLAPELGLLAAVLQQALHDARSRRADVRQEARQFLRDEAALEWWGEVLGVGDALQRHVRDVLCHGR
jgi:hypothetical protein